MSSVPNHKLLDHKAREVKTLLKLVEKASYHSKLLETGMCSPVKSSAEKNLMECLKNLEKMQNFNDEGKFVLDCVDLANRTLGEYQKRESSTFQPLANIGQTTDSSALTNVASNMATQSSNMPKSNQMGNGMSNPALTMSAMSNLATQLVAQQATFANIGQISIPTPQFNTGAPVIPGNVIPLGVANVPGLASGVANIVNPQASGIQGNTSQQPQQPQLQNSGAGNTGGNPVIGGGNYQELDYGGYFLNQYHQQNQQQNYGSTYLRVPPNRGFYHDQHMQQYASCTYSDAHGVSGSGESGTICGSLPYGAVSTQSDVSNLPYFNNYDEHNDGVGSGQVVANHPNRSNTVIVNNLPPSWTWQILKSKFRECGEVVFAEKRDNNTGVVRFANDSDAEAAINMFDQSRVDGRLVEVRFL